MEPEQPAADNAAANNTEGSDPKRSWSGTVRGDRNGSQWPKPSHTNFPAKGAPKKSAARSVKKKVPAAFNRSELLNTLTSIQGSYRVFGSIPVDRLPGAIKGPFKRLLDTIWGVRPPLWVYRPLP